MSPEAADKIHTVHHVGVAGATDLCIRELTDKERTMDLKPGDTRRHRFEARIGIALFGGFRDQGKLTPFDAEFQENYASGTGNTEEEAIEALKKDINEISESLWH